MLRRYRKKSTGKVVKAKVLYKRKGERNFNENNPRAAWQQMQTMTGYKDTNRRVMDCKQDFVDSLFSEFYARFDVHDFSTENDVIIDRLSNIVIDSNEVIVFSEHEVRNVFAKTNVKKASGPDHISNKVLNRCSQQLAYVLHVFIN